MRTQDSIRADRERSGKRNRAGQSQRSGAERESEKTSGARSGRSRNRSGAVSGLNLPLMPLQPVVFYTICTLHFLEAKHGPGAGRGTSRLDFGGNPTTFSPRDARNASAILLS